MFQVQLSVIEKKFLQTEASLEAVSSLLYMNKSVLDRAERACEQLQQRYHQMSHPEECQEGRWVIRSWKAHIAYWVELKLLRNQLLHMFDGFQARLQEVGKLDRNAAS